MKNQLTDADYINAAKLLNCEVAAIKAVAEVESSGSGFQADGQPRILFERHWFHKLTNGKYSAQYPDISNPTPGGYGPGGQNQHNRLAKAAKLDRNAALQSASWGKFQIMGFNFKQAGYKDLQTFINAAYNSEADHLNMFVNFILSKNLQGPLQRKEWAAFAYLYNGSNYKINKYDTKMAAAYRKYSNK